MSTLREKIHANLSTDPALNSLERKPSDYYEAGAAPSDAPTPYLVYRVLDVNRTPIAAMRQKRVQLWAHDKPGSYADVEAILRATLAPMAAVAGATDTGWVSDVTWEGESQDLYDDATQTIVRYRTYLLTGSGV